MTKPQTTRWTKIDKGNACQLRDQYCCVGGGGDGYNSISCYAESIGDEPLLKLQSDGRNITYWVRS